MPVIIHHPWTFSCWIMISIVSQFFFLLSASSTDFSVFSFFTLSILLQIQEVEPLIPKLFESKFERMKQSCHKYIFDIEIKLQIWDKTLNKFSYQSQLFYWSLEKERKNYFINFWGIGWRLNGCIFSYFSWSNNKGRLQKKSDNNFFWSLPLLLDQEK